MLDNITILAMLTVLVVLVVITRLTVSSRGFCSVCSLLGGLFAMSASSSHALLAVLYDRRNLAVFAVLAGRAFKSHSSCNIRSSRTLRSSPILEIIDSFGSLSITNHGDICQYQHCFVQHPP